MISAYRSVNPRLSSLSSNRLSSKENGKDIHRLFYDPLGSRKAILCFRKPILQDRSLLNEKVVSDLNSKFLAKSRTTKTLKSDFDISLSNGQNRLDFFFKQKLQNLGSKQFP